MDNKHDKIGQVVPYLSGAPFVVLAGLFTLLILLSNTQKMLFSSFFLISIVVVVINHNDPIFNTNLIVISISIDQINDTNSHLISTKNTQFYREND